MIPSMQVKTFQSIYIGAALLVAAALTWQLLPVLSPIVLFIAFAMVLAPFVRAGNHLRLLLAFGFLFFIWLIKTLGSLLAPFVLALVIAYVLNPLVDAMERRGVPRLAAIGIIIVPVIAGIVVAGIFGIPALMDQAERLINQLPSAIQRTLVWIEGLRARASRSPLFDTESIDRLLSSFTPDRIGAYIEAQRSAIVQRLWGGLMGVGRGVSILITILGYVFLVPVLVIYSLLDFHKLKARAADLIPLQRRATVLPFIGEYDQLLARWLRGQAFAAAVVGVLTWLGLWALGFPYSGIVGVVAGVFNLVPYLGLVVSLIPALIIAATTGSFLLSMGKVGIVFVVVNVLDANIIGPRVIGGSVGLHPIWVMLAIALGGFFFGFIGLLLAMPAAVLIKLLLREAFTKYKLSRVYRGVESSEIAPRT